jgi:hypothetical protein
LEFIQDGFRFSRRARVKWNPETTVHRLCQSAIFPSKVSPLFLLSSVFFTSFQCTDPIMNSRRIASSWNNQRDLEFLDEEGPRRGREWMTSRPAMISAVTADTSRPRRVHAETMVGKAIELEREESSEEDGCEGLSFRDKRLLLARKRSDAMASTAHRLTLGVGNYATEEYGSRRLDCNLRSMSTPRSYDCVAMNGHVSGAQESPEDRRVSSRVLSQQTDFIEVTLDSAISLKRHTTQPALPQQRLRSRSSSLRRSSSDAIQSLSPANDDVSSLGSTGSDAYSSRNWLPPKLKAELTPSSYIKGQKIPLERKNYPLYGAANGSSPESLDDAHPPKYVSALNRRSSSSKEYQSATQMTEAKTQIPQKVDDNNRTHPSFIPASNIQFDKTKALDYTKTKSDSTTFQLVQKVKSLRKSRLNPSSSAHDNRDPAETSSNDKAAVPTDQHKHTSNSTAATGTTSSTTISSLLPSSIKNTIPLGRTKSTHYADSDDDRSIKSSISNYTTRTDRSGGGLLVHTNGHLEQAKLQRLRRRKMALMNHVLTCTHPPPSAAANPDEYVPCPKLKCCYALTILIRHAQTCNFVSKDGIEQCDVPSCADFKKAWLHFRRCAAARSDPSNKKQTCLLCSDLSISIDANKNNSSFLVIDNGK